MRIVEERIFQGANCFLPVPAIMLAVERDGEVYDPSAIGRAVNDINQAIKPLDNPFTPARLEKEFPAASASAELAAALALVLQRQSVYTARQARVTGDPRNGNLLIAFEARHARLGLLAGRTAVRLCAKALSAAGNGEPPLADLVEEFRSKAASLIPDIETRLLLVEAERRGIPWFKLAENIPVVQLGQGARRRRFRNTMPETTGDTAYRLASFKPLAAHLLREHGIPLPPQGIAESEDHAVALARQLRFPVVVKPVGMDRGIGVRVGIANEAELRSAYRDSRVHGALQVEKHLPGFDYRFTFIHGDLVGVLQASPPIIEGDGRATVRQLVEAEPATSATVAPRKVLVDEEVLGRIAAAGYAMDDVLPAGERIVLRLWWRHRLDHRLENVTAIAHPQNVDAARLAVELTGLDVAGVDYIATDVSRPFHETGGAFTEVNPMPAMAGAQRAGIGAYKMLVDAVFPGGETGRIDVAVLLGARGADAVASALELALARAGHQVGVATRSRFEVGGRPVRRPEAGEAERGRTILRHPRTTAAILQATEAAIVAEGLALDRCRVGVLLLPDASSQSVDTARLLCAITDGAIVMDVEDPRAEYVVSTAPAARIMWIDSAPDGPRPVLRRPGDAILKTELRQGNRVVVIEEGQSSRELDAFAHPPSGDDASDRAARRAALTAIAAAIGLGLSRPSIGIDRQAGNGEAAGRSGKC